MKKYDMSYNEISDGISKILSSGQCNKEIWGYLKELADHGKIQLESEE